MAEEPLLTLKQLAAELGLPESTVRYYRDQYIDQIPSVGTGRRRRYPPEAVAILRSIAESYAGGGSRSDIVAGMVRAPAVPVVGAEPAAAHTLEHVTNLDLLAAILDGEREQRDALWQMAKEIVRLTEVLQEQDQVLGDIADKAGVVVQGRMAARRATPALKPAAEVTEGTKGTEVTDVSLASAPKSHPSPPSPPSRPSPPPPSPPSHPSPSSPPSVDSSAMERLRAELESERQLVERLREAKLQLEHRTADAEAALQQQRGGLPRKSASVIRRLLGGNADEE